MKKTLGCDVKNPVRRGWIQRKIGGLAAVMAAGVVAMAALAPPAAAKYAAIVIDSDTGRVLHSRNADTRNFPASLTKMMTLYMLFEALEDGRLTMDQQLRVSRRAAGQTPSRLGLQAGSSITVRDAIGALVVKSANDTATVVAEAIGETEIKFALMMTERARELGMRSTTFRNASGLPNRGQLSTARDMATLALALLNDFPQHYGIFSAPNFAYAGRTYRSHNNLLASYNGTDGIKTGYTRASGFNLVASVERDGKRLIGVVFGGRTAKSRDAQMKKILNNSFQLAQQSPATVRARPIPKPAAISGDGTQTALFGAEKAEITQTPVRRMPALPRLIPTAAAREATLTPPTPSGAWGIQVGAFFKFEQAHLAAGVAADKLPTLTSAAAIEIQATNSKGRTLYRARLLGISEDQANRSCSALRGQGRDCALITPDGSLRL